jgi:cell fate (sporulation/competence/biofilm development) regulator YlbF (YheA/YmcA/DUF963 family)
MTKYEIIINKAKELSALIEKHDITLKYRASLEKMKNDVSAQKILAELVRIGGELKNHGEGGTESLTGKAELEILKNEFDKNTNVRDHILIQRQYLDLIRKVQDRIKNPVK